MNTRTDTEVQAYLDRLRRELAGLPAAEIEEIVQDLEPQVAAIAAGLDAEPAESSGTTLADLLGDPAEYARELRSAMGVPDKPSAERPLWLTRTALAVLVVTTVAASVAGYLVARIYSNDPRPALVFLAFALFASWLAIGVRRTIASEIAALPELRLVAARLSAAEHFLPVAAYLRSLRPAWFLVRAGLVWLGMVWLWHWFGWYEPVPSVLAVAGAVLTMVVARRTAHDRRWLWLSLPLSGWAVGVAIKAVELLPILTFGAPAW
ncbi:MAG: hypothetical protein WBA97_37990 [Actinophytocola sp.]|uniref:DUF1700 domain-containing protein n=1 Tax=Actinophytocola sp. TaxID=1872138 RepID=UPI003C77B70C